MKAKKTDKYQHFRNYIENYDELRTAIKETMGKDPKFGVIVKMMELIRKLDQYNSNLTEIQNKITKVEKQLTPVIREAINNINDMNEDRKEEMLIDAYTLKTSYDMCIRGHQEFESHFKGSIPSFDTFTQEIGRINIPNMEFGYIENGIFNIIDYDQYQLRKKDLFLKTYAKIYTSEEKNDYYYMFVSHIQRYDERDELLTLTLESTNDKIADVFKPWSYEEMVK